MAHSPSDDDIVQDSEELILEYLDQMEEDLDFFESKIINTTVESLFAESDEILRKLHSNKGTSAALGFTIMTQAIHKVEDAVINFQKSKNFDEEFFIQNFDIQRKVIELSRDDSLSRNEYLHAYENLRSGLAQKATKNKGTHVMVIDKSNTTKVLLKGQLEGTGIHMTACSDGLVALGKILHSHYDIVICGGQVIGMDGLALISMLKLNEATEHIKTVLVSSDTNKVYPVKPDLVMSRTNKEFLDLVDWIKNQASELEQVA